MARVRAALRRAARTDVGEVATFDGIAVDFTKMEVMRDGQPAVLTAQEFKTLKFLVQNAERVISRDELLNEVWGYQNYPSTRTVDNFILRLRKKLERDPANPVHFRTVHGVGYKFVRTNNTVQNGSRPEPAEAIYSQTADHSRDKGFKEFRKCPTTLP